MSDWLGVVQVVLTVVAVFFAWKALREARSLFGRNFDGHPPTLTSVTADPE